MHLFSMRTLIIVAILGLFFSACHEPSPQAQPTVLPTLRPVTIIQHEPFDWATNTQRIQETGCYGTLDASCSELAALGCDEVKSPRFFQGYLDPPIPVMECVHSGDISPDPAYFRKVNGLDPRYRTFAVFQDGQYTLLIKKSAFRDLFAPVESPEEALSYAMAMTSLSARFDFSPNDSVEYLVDQVEETHAEETPDGFRVYLFDWSHRMGCDTHSFYAVTVLVTPAGQVREVERTEIYRSYACFDFGTLELEDN